MVRKFFLIDNSKSSCCNINPFLFGLSVIKMDHRWSLSPVVFMKCGQHMYISMCVKMCMYIYVYIYMYSCIYTTNILSCFSVG